MKILIAGSAGFIGSALAERLVSEGHEVLGIDNFSGYYEGSLKLSRLERCGFDADEVGMIYGEKGEGGEKEGNRHAILRPISSRRNPKLQFLNCDICDSAATEWVVCGYRPDAVVNLAARPGVRASMNVPRETVKTNLIGFFNILEASRLAGVAHFLYASSSSVYGNNQMTPFREADACRDPLSVYAATKLSNEAMAHAYSNAYGMRTTGIRMFSVYGPWGRPDMAPVIFARAMLDGDQIELFGGGSQTRDFTYIDDVVESIFRLLSIPLERGESEVFNIGSGRPVPVREFLGMLEKAMGRRTSRVTAPEQPGEARRTFADSSKLRGATGFHPSTTLEEGLSRFASWAREYYGRVGEQEGE